MSFTDKKREEIKKYMLRKIALDDADVINKTLDNFGISVTSVKRYMQDFLKYGIIMNSEDRKCGYKLSEQIYFAEIDLEQNHLQEDQLFELHIARYLQCNDEALRIWQYTCSEMLNNAIEHSRGKKLYIEVHTNQLNSKVVILDDGVGVFQTLLEYMSGQEWENPGPEDALVELYKGKITCDEEHHSGEGIFFSSKMTDEFVIWSDDRLYINGVNRNPKTICDPFLSYGSRIEQIGTMVFMTLENETARRIAEVFNMYTDMELGLIRTCIPVKEACVNGEPVARSQARRICHRLDTFKEVILDFKNVEFMGQGFADELFRVYATAHPEVILLPVHILPDIERMIRHVNRGNVLKNIIINT